jgi:RpiR family transcriptional regulator, glv operon transcriptional regulator
MDELAKHFSELTTSEQRVFTYVYNAQKEVAKMKINDLATVTFTSKTVIINMTQKLGFSGFADFKYYLKSSHRSHFKSVDSVDAEFYLKDNFNKTLGLIDRDVLKNVSRQIQKAKTVYIVARGTSKAVGNYLEHLLLTIGIRCIFLDDYNLISIVSLSLEPNEFLILLSLSGNTTKMVEIANMAKTRGAKTASITNFTTNNVSKISDYNLFCSSDDALTKDNDSKSRIGMFVVAELLVATIKQNPLV